MSDNVADQDADVVVAGGGIGGLANAYALASTGHRVRVLEQAASFEEVGAGLQLAPNATRILDEWGMLDEVIAAGVLPRRLVLKDAVDGGELTSVDLEEDFRARYGAPYVVIHRSDLLEILHHHCKEAGVELTTRSRVDRAESDDSTASVFVDGTRHRAGAVLAADGLWSGLRRRFSDDEPISSGYVAYRGTIPANDVAAMQVEMSPDDVVAYIGPECHFVHYPLRGGQMFNLVAVFRSPGHLRGEPDWGGPEELDDAFARCCDQVRGGTAYLWRDRQWRMFDRLPMDRWVGGRIALTGDAAHPMLQYLAQGACQAMEDGYVLSREASIRRAGRSTPWPEVLAAYSAARTGRTARVQNTARAWGDLWHCDGLTRRVRNELLRMRDPADYRHLDWLYGPPRSPQHGATTIDHSHPSSFT